MREVWLSTDPLQEKYPNISTYAYCALNPVKYVDPDGRQVGVPFGNMNFNQTRADVYNQIGQKAFKLTGKDGTLELYSTKIGDNIIEFGGDVTRKDGVLTIKIFDIDGTMTNELGVSGVRDLITNFGKE